MEDKIIEKLERLKQSKLQDQVYRDQIRSLEDLLKMEVYNAGTSIRAMREQARNTVLYKGYDHKDFILNRVNKSMTPNCEISNMELKSIKKIKAGEELTVNF